MPFIKNIGEATMESKILNLERWRCQLVIGCMLFLAVSCLEGTVTHSSLIETNSKRPAITMQTSDSVLLQRFEWAVTQAMAYVHHGEDPVGLWYEAALPKREAFCMRDVAHQSGGAHVLGLQAHTKNMLYKFAENISESKDWCSYWEINRYDKPAPQDYKSDQEFWYNLPANFDVLHACLQQYKWTGDRDYLEDPVFANFYARTMNEYIDHWKLSVDEIMTRDRFMHTVEPLDSAKSFQTCRGLPSYRENEPLNFYLGSDQIAFLYQAHQDYAEILRLQKKPEQADLYEEKANQIQSFFNDVWWDENLRSYYSSLHMDGTRKSSPDRYSLTSGISRFENRDQVILNQLKGNTDVNVESLSYYPQTFYNYDANEAAYDVLMDLTRSDKPRREYPEVSYGVVEAMVMGMMGLKSENTIISTKSRLSENTFWVKFDNIPIHENLISLRHDGRNQSTFHNQSKEVLVWRACFDGDFDQIIVNGRPIKTTQSTAISGQLMSWVEVEVSGGEHVTATIL